MSESEYREFRVRVIMMYDGIGPAREDPMELTTDWFINEDVVIRMAEAAAENGHDVQIETRHRGSYTIQDAKELLSGGESNG